MHIQPNLCAALIEQGWDGASEPGLVSTARVKNRRHRHLSLEVLGPDAVRLYIHPNGYNSARRVGVRSQTINATRPNFRRSLTRWVSSACFALAEVWAQEDEEKALLKVRETRRTEILTEMLDGTGFTADEFSALARVEWAWLSDEEIRTETPRVDRADLHDMITSADNWDGRTRVRKLANLLTFLQQEGWR